MKQTGIIVLILIFALILVSGSIGRSINSSNWQKEQGHSEIRYGMVQEFLDTGGAYPAAGIHPTPIILTSSPSPSPSDQNFPVVKPRTSATLRESSNSPGGMLVYYNFEDDFTSSGRVTDLSGNGHDAMLQGTPRIVPGVRGKQAIQFDGNSYILTDTNPVAGRKDVTWAFWFNTENPDNNYKMASAAWWHGGPGSGWTMATHIPEFWAEDTKGVCLSNIINADNQFLRGQWNFEVVTYDGSIIREYTNGKLINAWQTRGVPLGAGSPMVIGGWPDVGFLYTGSIDEFIIYDHPLTAEEISHQYSPLIPTITAIKPNSGPTAGGTLITITGDGFTGVTKVMFGTTPASSFTVDSSTQITATSPTHTDGTVDVTVTTPEGTSTTSSGDEFTYHSMIPEFPSPIIPFVVVVGLLGVILYFGKIRNH